jgi:hypothetical protein
MRFEHNCYSPSGDFVELSRSSEEDVEQALRELADWLYQRLRQANEYLTSDEAIVETIDANDYEFDVDGKLTS